MKLNQRGEVLVVMIASWIIITGFLGVVILVGSAMTRSSRTDLDDYKEIHQDMPKDYDKMNNDQKRLYWRKYFDERKKGG